MNPKKILDNFFGNLSKRPKKSKNTRRHRRLKAFNLIKFTLSSGASYETLSNVVNLSENGLQFTCYEPLVPDQSIRLLIHIPRASEEVPVQGRLAWVKRMDTPRGVYVAGVEFKEISEHHRGLLREMVEKSRSQR